MLKKESSAQYLTHKYNALYGCNMSEFGLILLCVFSLLLMLSVCIGIITSIVFSVFVPGALGGIILLLVPGYYSAIAIVKKIGKAKEGKQEGYFKLKLRRWLTVKLPFIFTAQIYVNRCGVWSTQRHRGQI